MSNNELYTKYLGPESPWKVYYFANIIDIPLTDYQRHNYKRDGIEFPDDYTYKGLPEPQNYIEAWEQFTKYKAQMSFESVLMRFLDTDKNLRRESLEFELKEINEFIDRANRTIKPSKACADPDSRFSVRPDFSSWEEEYIRLSNGYYNDRWKLLYKGDAGSVYGKYFMFKEWLENMLSAKNVEDIQSKEAPLLASLQLQTNRSTMHDEIDELISHIDEGLVHLYQASEDKREYIHFDFQTRLSRLLRLFADSNGYRKNYILNFYYIFQDLYSIAGTDVYTLKEIKENMNTSIWEKMQRRPNKAPEAVLIERGIDSDNFYGGQSPLVISLSKIACLLEYCSTEEKDFKLLIQDNLFFSQLKEPEEGKEVGIERLYKKCGFDDLPFWESSPTRFFKQYAEELLLKYNQQENVKGPTSELLRDKPQQTLLDIWAPGPDGDKAHYFKFIDKLKEKSLQTDAAFVNERGGNLYWNESIRGDRKYLAAFIYQMTIKGWIPKWYKAPTYKGILECTFNFKFNDEPFKGLERNPPALEYSAPFSNWETNL